MAPLGALTGSTTRAARARSPLATTPDGRDGDRALNPGNRYPDWQQAVATRLALRIGLYRPGRDTSRVRCPLLVLVCDRDQTALAGPAADAASEHPPAS